MIRYQKTVDGVNVGEPGDLPEELIGLADESLADLSWVDHRLGYQGAGFVPVDVPPPLADQKAVKLAAAGAVYAAKIAAGYPVTLEGVAETLQVRNDTDRTNWLGLKSAAKDAIDAGNGSDLYPVKIRTTSNARYALTNDAAFALMSAVLVWLADHMDAFWDIADAIEAAADADALAAIDLEAGYP